MKRCVSIEKYRELEPKMRIKEGKKFSQGISRNCFCNYLESKSFRGTRYILKNQ